VAELAREVEAPLGAALPGRVRVELMPGA
jgi:hypothetical protein